MLTELRTDIERLNLAFFHLSLVDIVGLLLLGSLTCLDLPKEMWDVWMYVSSKASARTRVLLPCCWMKQVVNAAYWHSWRQRTEGENGENGDMG